MAAVACSTDSASMDASRELGSMSVVGLSSVGIVLFCVLMHYEALSALSLMLRRLRIRPRPRILVMILTLLMIHVAEIWVFGIGAWLLTRNPAHGALVGAYPLGLLDYVYYSAVCYTTLGLGDLHPLGNIRFLTGTESLTGFMLIGWSVSFTYLEMDRFWRS